MICLKGWRDSIFNQDTSSNFHDLKWTGFTTEYWDKKTHKTSVSAVHAENTTIYSTAFSVFTILSPNGFFTGSLKLVLFLFFSYIKAILWVFRGSLPNGSIISVEFTWLKVLSNETSRQIQSCLKLWLDVVTNLM